MPQIPNVDRISRIAPEISSLGNLIAIETFSASKNVIIAGGLALFGVVCAVYNSQHGKPNLSEMTVEEFDEMYDNGETFPPKNI